MDSDVVTTESLLRRLLTVRAGAVDAAERRRVDIDAADDTIRPGAENLLHYLAVRNVDLRAEQIALAERGLSSLGRAEAHVLATIDAVISRLAADLAAHLGAAPIDVESPADLGAVGPSPRRGRELLDRHAVAALGPAPARRRTRVMVTLPTEAATDQLLVDRFVAAGMSVARINAAHDRPSTWSAMAARVADAAERQGRDVRIMVDLPGPKLRTGPLVPGPAVVKVRPDRDEYGRVLSAGRVIFRAADAPPAVEGEDGLDGVVVEGGLDEVVVDGDVIDAAQVGDRLALVDARGRRRLLTVIESRPRSVVATTDRTVYFVPGLDVALLRGRGRLGEGRVVRVPARPGSIQLHAGDLLELVAGRRPGRNARLASDGSVEAPATISVDVPGLFPALRRGARVLFDDGRIESVVDDVGTGRATLRVTRPARATLRAEKGVNLPDVDAGVAALTAEDHEILGHVVAFAHLVALSYVSHATDVSAVHDELDRLGASGVGLVLKIEHRVAFEQLPELLLVALRRPPVAVMVARGDLAVELGYERLAEVQEEVLWLSEAAHVPVIWATQVLESLAKRGAPTRAEVTDAAWSSRAECVMLNKGPFIPETIEFLGDVLERMSGHQSKRMPMLRRLSVVSPAWAGRGPQPEASDGSDPLPASPNG